MLIIGDVHGKIAHYKELIDDIDCSLQVGDMGFDYSSLDDVSEDHRFIGGNHDNYDNPHPRMLADFGLWRNVFYIRGAYSIDRIYRTPGIDWFCNEELSYTRCEEAFDAYRVMQPDVVVTHAAPMQVVAAMGLKPIQTNTGLLLDACFDMHAPSLWIFGHYHRSWSIRIGGTKFICLNELETYEL